MPDYQPYLIPLIRGISSHPDLAEVTSPLDEEIWLASHADAPLSWEHIAVRVKSVYGIQFIHREADMEISQCNLLVHSRAGFSRYFTSTGRVKGFAMEHPAQLTDYDRLCPAEFPPVLIKPSLFGKLLSMLLAGRVIPEKAVSKNFDSTLAFRNDLREMVQSQPSDWHLEPRKEGFEMRLRFNGLLGPVQHVSQQKGTWYINSLRQACGRRESTGNEPLDGSFKLADTPGAEVSLRVSMIPSIHGLSAAVRFLYEQSQSSITLTALGMNQQQQSKLLDCLSGPEGMILVCGPTGSGKTTTLHTLLNISVRQNLKVLSAEDPVERIVPGVQQVQVESGNGSGFATALKAFMRQAPDTILIGEIRDPETAETAIQSAFSGHRILATLHAGDTNGVHSRLVDFGLQRATLRQAINLVIHQRLVALLCNDCKVYIRLPGELCDKMREHAGAELDSCWIAPGCGHCQNGYASRTALFVIDERQDNERSRHAFQRRAIELLCEGKIDLKTAISYQKLELRRAFSFHSCKDFANYSPKHTPG